MRGIKIQKCLIIIATACLSLMSILLYNKFSDTEKIKHITEKNDLETKTAYLENRCMSENILENCLSLLGQEIEPIEIQLQSGKTVTTGIGKAVVELMNINCKHCNGNMPYVLETKDMAEVPIYTCTYADDPIAVEEWQDNNNYDFDMGFVSYDLVKYDLGLKYTPCFLFLDNNEVSFVYIGDIYSEEDLLKMIELAY